MPSRKTKKEREQTQKQSQNVRVVVNIPEKKRKRKRRQKPKQPAPQLDYKAFPQIIYGNQPLTIYGSTPQQTLMEKPIRPKMMLEDIGQVGTEGRVEILDLPPKSEILGDLEEPVPLPKPFTDITPYMPLKKDRIPVSLADIVARQKPILKMTDFYPLEQFKPKQTEEEFGVSIENISREATQQTPTPKTKRRTPAEIRQSLFDEYERLIGVKRIPTVGEEAPIISNKQLKKMISSEKKKQQLAMKATPLIQPRVSQLSV